MNDSILYSVLKKPHVTEKSSMLASLRQHVFTVASWANKKQIRVAVERIFKVKVLKVSTSNKGSVKKAFVSLAEGQEINWTDK